MDFIALICLYMPWLAKIIVAPSILYYTMQSWNLQLECNCTSYCNDHNIRSTMLW